MRISLKKLNQWLKDNRTLPLATLMKKLKQKLEGYYRYYGITDNSKCLAEYRHRVRRMTFKWLNRRSQKKSYTWEQFDKMIKRYGLPYPKIHVNIFILNPNLSYIL
jgi:hypothetical protein